MLTIRMKRTGRKGHPQYRFVVQDSRFSPSSGRVVSYIGSYNPHSKQTILDKQKVEQYLANGAQPSDRVARMLKSEGIKLPDWVKLESDKKRSIKNIDKLRKNRPAEENAPSAEENPAPAEGAPETKDDKQEAASEAETTPVENEPGAESDSKEETEEKAT